MKLKNNQLQVLEVLEVVGKAERVWNKAWIFILKKAKEEPPLPLHWRVVKSMQVPGCISQGGQKAAAGMSLAPCPAMPGRLQGCPSGAMAAAPWLWGWLDSCWVSQPWHALPRAPWAPWASRLPARHRDSSARGAEQERQQPGLLETNPRADLSLGSQAQAALQLEAGPAAPAGPGPARGLQPWAAAPRGRATARAHLCCFLGRWVLLTLHEWLTGPGDRVRASVLQLETQMIPCPASAGQ